MEPYEKQKYYWVVTLMFRLIGQWDALQLEYKEMMKELGAVPFFSQTRFLTQEDALTCFGEEKYHSWRSLMIANDPNNKFRSDYLNELMGLN